MNRVHLEHELAAGLRPHPAWLDSANLRTAIIFAVVLLFGDFAHAQRVSRIQAPGGDKISQSASLTASAQLALLATLPPTLRLSVSDINFNVMILDPSQYSAVITVPITSSWTLSNSISKVEMVAYFDSARAAFSDGSNHVVPSDHVLGGLNDEVLLPFVETPKQGTPEASRTLYRQSIFRANLCGSRVDTLRVQLRSIGDLGAPSGEYTGTLHLRLVSF